MDKIIVLDRDGVINQDSDAFIKHPDEWLPEPGSLEAISKLKANGWIIAVATNQSGIRREYYSRQTLHAMHMKMVTLLRNHQAKVDWISYSPYLGDDGAPCRKPGTGMLRAIEKRFDTSLAGKYLIGDSLGDIKAAQAMNMIPLLVRTGKGERTIASGEDCLADVKVFDNLEQAVDSIL